MRVVNKKPLRTLFLILWVVFSCSEEDKINEAPIAVIHFSDGIDRILLDATSSSDAEKRPLTFEWTASNKAIEITGNKYPKASFRIPAGTEETSVEVTLKVSDSKRVTKTTVPILIPPLTQIRSSGLGRDLNFTADNTAPYPWYMDQASSGIHASVNCGPASVTMAAKWANENFNYSIEDARNTYRSGGGWWFTNDIINYLNLHQIDNRTISLTNSNSMKAAIDNGDIIILCLDMFYVPYTDEPEYRVNKFYTTNNTGWGHFIVVKGYKEIDQKILYESYDPYSWDNKYQDQTYKGMNRYYRAADLDKATQLWWDYAIVVSKGSLNGKYDAVDTDKIIHKPGR